MKKLLLILILITSLQAKAFPKTEYPLTHFFLNLIGPMCIIKGSSVSIPGINFFINIEKQVNWSLISAGAFCLLTSRALLIMEKKSREEEFEF